MPQNDAGRLVGASLILLSSQAVLMVRRGKPPFDELWSFPGGHVEAGESAEAASRRELREETGLVAGDIVPIGRFQPLPERSALWLDVFAGALPAGEAVAADDAREVALVPFGLVGGLRTTPGATGWIARAIQALCPGLPGGGP
ncbi:ADP-ribose pyrophosphatase YjhB, NUDIX family [Faunimonas pinastri]|uniref:ADP-ribose pyrophosphatase YjhB, NUDIX family n=1 Tax=Faunimonas pinastri TaxID=1855383 RepID=A0A1H8ZVQ8_9HYPH|nr:NUDIX domain-containing protein [Faunimonas pinastri]SEP68361.1 ADP-ribose pyrophosphatase YjhB, NUDIX family [Faunimonas pinastri]